MGEVYRAVRNNFEGQDSRYTEYYEFSGRIYGHGARFPMMALRISKLFTEMVAGSRGRLSTAEHSMGQYRYGRQKRRCDSQRQKSR